MEHDARVFHVHGRVQGVGFRWWARSLAERLRLHGTVRNLPDGTVELVASGEPEALEELRRCLRRGPPGARVERIRENPTERPTRRGFHITA